MRGPTGAQVFNGLSVRAKMKVILMAHPDVSLAWVYAAFLARAKTGALTAEDMLYDYKVGVLQVMEQLLKESHKRPQRPTLLPYNSAKAKETNESDSETARPRTRKRNSRRKTVPRQVTKS